jgi:hypothetical protein
MTDQNVVNVQVNTGVPAASGSWDINMSGLPLEHQLAYSNLAYTLVAGVMTKLGVEYSKLILDGDHDRLETEVGKVMEALSAGVVRK